MGLWLLGTPATLVSCHTMAVTCICAGTSWFRNLRAVWFWKPQEAKKKTKFGTACLIFTKKLVSFFYIKFSSGPNLFEEPKTFGRFAAAWSLRPSRLAGTNLFLSFFFFHWVGDGVGCLICLRTMLGLGWVWVGGCLVS